LPFFDDPDLPVAPDGPVEFCETIGGAVDDPLGWPFELDLELDPQAARARASTTARAIDPATERIIGPDL
jgi:hypothetical protein